MAATTKRKTVKKRKPVEAPIETPDVITDAVDEVAETDAGLETEATQLPEEQESPVEPTAEIEPETIEPEIKAEPVKTKPESRNPSISPIEIKRGKLNALIWRHPENPLCAGWEAERKSIKPAPGQFSYDFEGSPLYFCCEEKTTDKDGNTVFVLQVYTPAFDKDVLTPQQCQDATDWTCADDFEAVEDDIFDKIKIGAIVAMSGICLMALIIFAAMAMGPGG
jgi:hypothetical protein